MNIPKAMKLKILYACTRCGLVYEGNGYNLNYMYGYPAICPDCTEKAYVELFDDPKLKELT